MRNHHLIRKCGQDDELVILRIINESAKAYRGVIPEDRYHEPYMSLEELQSEMSEMIFFGYQEDDELLAVAGYQPVRDVSLVRHIYVLPEHQRRGIGGNFFEALAKLKHAWDLWKADPYLVTTERFEEEAKRQLGGTFHEIKPHIRIINWQEIVKLFKLLRDTTEMEKQLRI